MCGAPAFGCAKCSKGWFTTPSLCAVQLGAKSGLRVSRLCLGTMNFGEPGRGHQGDWTLGIDDARAIFKAAIGAGLCYFDCAYLKAPYQPVDNLLSLGHS